MLGKWNDAHCGEKKGFICEAVLGPTMLVLSEVERGQNTI
jgi:hypothetical protein